MEKEDKVKIEETTINLGFVKKEMDAEELEFEEKQYRLALTLENMFGQNWIEQRNNGDILIGFSYGDAIMKTESGIIKEETKDFEQSDCKQCDGNYHGYCVNCTSLSHILNNIIPNVHANPVLNTTPINILETREVSNRRGVFALKTLRKGIILGPFEGIVPVKSANSLQWKIKNGKIVSDQSANWMKYIESTTSHALKNLDVFQFDGILFFETTRDIQQGEELLVCYGIEEEFKSNGEEEICLNPVKKVMRGTPEVLVLKS